MDGLLSAMMAEEGITSSAEIIEGARGFLAVMSSDSDARQAVEGLGSSGICSPTGTRRTRAGR